MGGRGIGWRRGRVRVWGWVRVWGGWREGGMVLVWNRWGVGRGVLKGGLGWWDKGGRKWGLVIGCESEESS